MGAYETGLALALSMVDKLPEKERAEQKKFYESPEAKEAVTLLGDSALARSDYSRNMDTIRQQTQELRTKEQQLTEDYNRLTGWWEVNRPALEEWKAMKAAGNGNGGQQPPKPEPEPVDPRQIAEQVVNEAGRDYIAAASFIGELVGKHYAMFGEPLDTMAIAYNPKLGKSIPGQPGRIFSLQDAYMEKHGDRLSAKAKELEDKRINDEVEKRLVEERKKLAPQGHPFPLRGEAPSVLDVLTTKEGPAAHTLDTAVAEYERLQQARGA